MKITESQLQQSAAHRESSRTDLSQETRYAVRTGLFGALMADGLARNAGNSDSADNGTTTAQGGGDGAATGSDALPPGFFSISAARGAESSSQSDSLRLRKILERLLADLLAILRGEGKDGAEGAPPLTLTDLWPTKAGGTGTSTGATASVLDQRPAVAVEWQSTTTAARYESESVSYCARGQVCTADGRQIDVSMDFALARESVAVSRVEQGGTAYAFKDPLVLTLPGGTANLDGPGLNFDLNGDGTREAIPFVGTGCALLAWDRNGNGCIDDGRELFGAVSGDGFAELAALDSDHNGWIDESDPVWGQLVLWQRQLENGVATDKLTSLKDAGIGALALGSVATPFLYRGAASSDDPLGDVQGRLRASGLYLMEDGRPGSLQQVDLAV